jgi:NAD(P)-dependent dehydrogenase (short-subunit alcohol dehydrogenase family)
MLMKQFKTFTSLKKHQSTFKTFSQKLFQDKVVIVTGSSQGIGRGTGIAFSKEGAKVLVADINVKGGQEVVDIIKSKGGEASFPF